MKTNSTSALRKILVAGLAAATLVVGVAATQTTAQAQPGWGVPLAAGVVGGLALGGAIASSNQGYYGPAPVYSGGECWMERRPVVDYYGNVIRYRRIRVCN